LQDAGIEEHSDYLNRRGIELARAARTNTQAPNVMVADGKTYWSFTGKHPPQNQLQANVEE